MGTHPSVDEEMDGPTRYDDVARQLRAAVDDAGAGRGSLILLRGADEAAKARAIEDALDHAGSRVQAVRVRCRRGTSAFAPWITVLRALQVEVPDQGSRFTRLSNLAVALVEAARCAGIAVFLEDVQEADQPSLLLLELLASAWPVGLTVVAAHGRVDPSKPIAQTLAELALEPAVATLVVGGEDAGVRPSAEATEDSVFRCEGDYWTIAFEGDVVRVRDIKGYHYLAALLRRPGERIHACKVLRDVRGEGEPADVAADAGVIAERARLTVAKGIRIALERIRSAHPLLSRHLSTTVRCGYFCIYAPDPRFPIRWTE